MPVVREGHASRTARWVARQRAGLGPTRPVRGDAEAEQRLYAGLAGRFPALTLAGPAGMAVRTRFFDRAVVEALDAGVAQVVNLGAGYDGRALRFSSAPARWFEVDHPATQADKLGRLEKIGALTDHITFVAIDLLVGDLDGELATAGHDADRPTLWLSEGLFPYLPEKEIANLCRTARDRSAPGSSFVANVLVRAPSHARSRAVRHVVDSILASIGETRQSEFPPGRAEGLLFDTGWEISAEDRSAPGRADGSYMLGFVATPAP